MRDEILLTTEEFADGQRIAPKSSNPYASPRRSASRMKEEKWKRIALTVLWAALCPAFTARANEGPRLPDWRPDAMGQPDEPARRIGLRRGATR